MTDMNDMMDEAADAAGGSISPRLSGDAAAAFAVNLTLQVADLARSIEAVCPRGEARKRALEGLEAAVFWVRYTLELDDNAE